MTAIPAADYFNGAITNADAKDAQDEILAVLREMLGGQAPSELTIESGAVTPTRALHSVDTESDAASDDLTTIVQDNHPDGRLLAIRAADPARAVVVKHGAGGTGQILLADGVDLTLTGAYQWLLLRRDGTTWAEFRPVQAATATRAGIVELATDAEAIAGSDAARAVTPSALAATFAALNFVPTGTVVPYVGAAAPTGWLLASGATIGDVTSGATARANADTEDLFTLLWENWANAQLPIQDSTGAASNRGASAAADFAAHKRLPLPDLRGRAAVGKDNMGGTSANRLTDQSGGLDGDVMGDTGGAETVTLTTSNIPSHSHNAGTLAAASDGAHTHGGGLGSGSQNFGISGSRGPGNTGSAGAHTHTITGATAAAGGGAAHNNVQPSIVLSMIIKL